MEHELIGRVSRKATKLQFVEGLRNIIYYTILVEYRVNSALLKSIIGFKKN
ncbi:hypothetical protein GCM10008906_23370 [Clostridium oceanicum]|uniref:Uncharacterized protein n=1 Tax=Clostridium oceanicum TaxID=1543 RepID=A0ABN1JKH6_9CLOT